MPDTPFFAHPQALVESNSIGEGTRIWAFAHVQKGAVLGSGCNVGDHSFIESGVVIGNDVTIKNGVSIWEGVMVEDSVFIGPNAVFTNDLRPRSKVYHATSDKTLVRKGASIGANATIVAGIELGEYAMIGAGSVVTKSVAPFELVVGVPAHHQGWVSRKGNPLLFEGGTAKDGEETYGLSNGVVSLQT